MPIRAMQPYALNADGDLVPVVVTDQGIVESIVVEADDPWTEGPNMLTNGDFEAAMPDLPWGDENWSAYNSDETVERVTASPISGTGSLHVVTTGAAAIEGAIGNATGDADSREVIRFRFTIKGSSGPVYAFVEASNAAEFLANKYTAYAGTPTGTPETIQRDMVLPDFAAVGQLSDVVPWTFAVYFVGYDEIADFTIDDVYLGVLTLA